MRRSKKTAKRIQASRMPDRPINGIFFQLKLFWGKLSGGTPLYPCRSLKESKRRAPAVSALAWPESGLEFFPPRSVGGPPIPPLLYAWRELQRMEDKMKNLTPSPPGSTLVPYYRTRPGLWEQHRALIIGEHFHRPSRRTLLIAAWSLIGSDCRHAERFVEARAKTTALALATRRGPSWSGGKILCRGRIGRVSDQKCVSFISKSARNRTSLTRPFPHERVASGKDRASYADFRDKTKRFEKKDGYEIEYSYPTAGGNGFCAWIKRAARPLYEPMGDLRSTRLLGFSMELNLRQASREGGPMGHAR